VEEVEEDKVLADKVLVAEVEEYIQDNLCHKCSFGVLYHQDNTHIEFQHTHLLLVQVVEVVVI
jgi:hypothetical protein